MSQGFLKLFFLCSFFSCGSAYAQLFTQSVRGTVRDKILQQPIAGATVRITGTNLGDQTDGIGNFIVPKVTVGIHQVVISAIGYQEVVLNNITLNSGKEMVLSILMEEKIVTGKETVIRSERKKNIPINDMSLVSVRSFSVEETSKYAAAVNDPSRMASNYAGVMMADDGNNQIVIRGNSPSGLLWRMEGIDIPNPNHFASAGSSGGGISIISSQLLSNSDFITGAFSSEYGNALSGVFDLKLRQGNNRKREYSIQAGVLGLNVAAEGPIMPWYKGSYLINYRYSTLGLLAKSGILEVPSATNFQDLSYNIYLPTARWGTFTLFGLGGLSDQEYKPERDSTQWKNYYDRYSSEFISNTGVWGATHSITLGKKNFIKTCAAYSITKNAFQQDYMQSDYQPLRTYDQKFITRKLTLTSSWNHKFNTKVNLRSGIIANGIFFSYQEAYRKTIQSDMQKSIAINEETQSVQVFSQLQYRPTEKLTVQAGLHSQFLFLNSSKSLEPRASLRYQMNHKHSWVVGYGLHSQSQGWGIYFAQQQNAQGQIEMPNRNLGFSKAHHFVVSHQYSIRTNLRLKTELYYQSLFNIPISIYDTSSFSVINMENDYVRDPLQNKGRGENYGLEVSLEKYLSKQLYYMISTSWYSATYTAADKRRYSSRFNGGQIINLVVGKEFTSRNQRRTFGLNGKCVYAGGYRTTPVNLAESIKQVTTVPYPSLAFTEKLPAYYRMDIRISMKWNRKRLTSTLSLDLQNATNRLNVYNRFYDPKTQTVKTYYQVGIIPILNYKLEW
jgi:hypothetical protein